MEESILKTEDYEYSEEELQELKIRSLSDRICNVSLNRYNLSTSNVFEELRHILEVKIQTLIINPMKSDQFQIKDGSEIESIMTLFDKLAKMSAVMNGLGSIGKGLPVSKKPQGAKPISQTVKEVKD